MKTFLATFLVVIVGSLVLWVSTDEGRAFTAEEARRLEIRETPRVDFIYTSCPDVCLILSGNLKTLQKDFSTEEKSDKLRFLSISFDPEKDTPQRLKEYLHHFSADFRYWMAARPINPSQKEAILDFFKVIVIPDEYGGYTHSAGYHIINPDGKLVAIFGIEQTDELHTYLNQVLEEKENVSKS
ncbi:protein SCO1/2 [Nitrosomonas eutropha]|uniref:SCO family protein n=1 Tax=Nitrosomonas eutropha TaxID=916 RepID=UPI0008959060|nr:SCO family protein [Nitrosomonas eutropha]SDW68879.1 protein SCO1/2 [Nitrosomonas eutropha]